MEDIARWGLITQFSYLQGPNMHWFGRTSDWPTHPQLQDEKWHEWAIVEMHPMAYEVALAIGIKILPVDRRGFPIDQQNENAFSAAALATSRIVNLSLTAAVAGIFGLRLFAGSAIVVAFLIGTTFTCKRTEVTATVGAFE